MRAEEAVRCLQALISPFNFASVSEGRDKGESDKLPSAVAFVPSSPLQVLKMMRTARDEYRLV